MPELPEVETVRRGLDAWLPGRWVTAVAVSGVRSVRRHPREEFVGRLLGARIVGTGRRGKEILLTLSTDEWLAIHLRMSGQVLRARPVDPEPPHTHVRIDLDDGSQLRFVDPRTFGELYLVRPGFEVVDAPGLARMGPEPIGLSRARFVRALTRRRTAVKGALMDPTVIAGIGNIYSDEICFAARVRYDHPTAALTPHQLGRLWRATGAILTAAIAAGGSTLGDAQYVDIEGRAGRYAEAHRVYAREGLPCLRCGRGRIVRHTFAQRSTYFCPRCQRPPAG